MCTKNNNNAHEKSNVHKVSKWNADVQKKSADDAQGETEIGAHQKSAEEDLYPADEYEDSPGHAWQSRHCCRETTVDLSTDIIDLNGFEPGKEFTYVHDALRSQEIL